MNKYLITLTPIDKFFFGGELTFTRSKRENIDKQRKDLNDAEDKELKSFDESFSSYFVRSRQFPQQTSLLGMLRFTFLSANKKAFKNGEIIDKQETIDTIGAESFKVDKDTTFGKIKKIYPCFLRRKTEGGDWENLMIAPMDSKLSIAFDKGDALLDDKKTKLPNIMGYNPKDGLTSCFIGSNVALETGKLFTEDIRIGIDRNYDGKPNDGAFYKQISYRLSDKYEFEKDGAKTEEKHKLCFAFYADLDNGLLEQIVTLGGDNSRFKLTCELKEGGIQLPESYHPKEFDGYEGKVVLLSDAFIDQDTMKNCLFSINETVPFRFLKSTVETTVGYNKFSSADKDNPTHLRRSDQKFNLYKTGSVFYFDTIEGMTDFTTAMENKKRFRQIGYNYYEKFPKQNNNNK